ncbi:hypothetical protein [Algoriphagus hitonicola]|uniref:WD40-like Beta Propeller Repeat n=1 Tax=Algoriphagus hitonicola TaxID=435880 RepID=A0A1I2P233_9BACT|nr:hypothetical protein [Algoriphagus hitonicola]SFG07511.1 hypothetical protein SAMN04487988_101316 [Algoriphagus hitonicola]
MRFIFSILVLLLFNAASWGQNQPKVDSIFTEGKSVKTISNPELEEMSGMAISRKHSNVWYTHTDSGGEPIVYFLDLEGNELGEITLKGVKNRDWEDMAIGPGPDGMPYIYVAEIGDNLAVHSEVKVYRFPEPENLKEKLEVNPEIATLVYPGGARDAESLLVDPVDGKLYLVSKRDKRNTLYSFSQEAFGNEGITEMEEHHKFSFSSSTAADISSDGSQILIKNYFAIYHWNREKGQSLIEALIAAPKQLPYVPEPQGEAIAFEPEGKFFYTISEKRFSISPVLYRYQAKD